MEFLEAFKPSKPYWRWALLLVLLGAVFVGVYQVYCGCPRVQATSPPDRLEVKRTVVLDERSMFPQEAPGDWVFGTSQAQAVLAAIDNLPASATDVRFCPLSDGTVFSYTFLRGHTTVLQTSADEGGCHVLRLSGCDIRQMDDHFICLPQREQHACQLR